MAYSSTVTSKGTITLPASIRKKLGIHEGNKVTIELKGEIIRVRPQAGWDEFFVQTADLGKKARDQITSGRASSLLTSIEITTAVHEAREKL